MKLKKVDAVNLILRAASLNEVSEIENTFDDAAIALRTLEQSSRDVQSKSWFFNTERNWKLAPNIRGQISIPLNARSVISAGSDYSIKNLVIRSNKIYDMNNHTYDLSQYVDKDGFINFTFLMELDFDDLPPIAQNYIVYKARRQFVQDFNPDPNTIKILYQEEMTALGRLETENIRNNKNNMLYDNKYLSGLVARIGGDNTDFI